jgi:2-C-methyl-D-erythritol 4-phosphate cytidylyltransferase
MLSAIIVAAGTSRRMGFDKLFAMLGDKPVLAHALRAFEQTQSVTEIIVVGRNDRLAELSKLVKESGLVKVTKIVAGGDRRQDSVRAGLNELDRRVDFVAVHDAARPLITPQQIERVFEIGRAHGSAVLAEPVRDTLKRVSADCFVSGSVDRESMYALQTPQVFSRDLLGRAYDAIFTKNLHVTDETSAIEHIGEKVAIVPNEDWNFKITYPSDLTLAEFVLQQRRR